MTTKIIFDDVFVSRLTAHSPDSNKPQQVFSAHFSFVSPTPVKSPNLIMTATEVASLLDINEKDLNSDEFLSLLSGNNIQLKSFASCYGGHQFGHWAGQLGDGRAITLGDKFNSRDQLWELQLKGAGPTPYSRRGDGRAVLRSSIREFICSEAMYHLGVPTTRALSLATTGEQVIRDMFYDGRAEYESSAIVARVAQSFVRFGNFELFTSRNDHKNLKLLAEYIIEFHYPEIHVSEYSRDEKYSKWFIEICSRTAYLIVDWMRVGFVHGVMNTDNLSILGLTIDYGPFGWLDNFDPNFTPNTSDRDGRYAFSKQASIAHWNLSALAQALKPLTDALDIEGGLTVFIETFNKQHNLMMCKKLGLKNTSENAKQISTLIDTLYKMLSSEEIDYTIFFNCLINFRKRISTHSFEESMLAMFDDSFYTATNTDRKTLSAFLANYLELVEVDPLDNEQAVQGMRKTNPVIIPRNYLIQDCIEAAEQSDYSKLEELFLAIKTPYDENHSIYFKQKRPSWAQHKEGCSALSCSS